MTAWLDLPRSFQVAAMYGLEARSDPAVPADPPDDEPVAIRPAPGWIAGPGWLLSRRTGVVFVADGLADADRDRALGVALAYHLRLMDELPERFPLRLATRPVPPTPTGVRLS